MPQQVRFIITIKKAFHIILELIHPSHVTTAETISSCAIQFAHRPVSRLKTKKGSQQTMKTPELFVSFSFDYTGSVLNIKDIIEQEWIKEREKKSFHVLLMCAVCKSNIDNGEMLNNKAFAYPLQCPASLQPFSLSRTLPASATTKNSSPDVDGEFHCCVRQRAAPRRALRA